MTSGPDEIAAGRRLQVNLQDLDLFAGGSSPAGKVPATVNGIRAGLAEAAARRDLADTLARDARADVRDWIAAALTHGSRVEGQMTIVEIAERAGVSRQHVHEIRNTLGAAPS